MTTEKKKPLRQEKSPSCPVGIIDCPVAAEVACLRQEVARLTKLVRTDTLTGIANYRFFLDALEHEMERTQRSGQATSLIMIDIDHFKQINDTWGHEIGNKALVHTAEILRQSVRKLDIPCRYGGEEFAVILPDTNLVSSIRVAERIRRMIAKSPLQQEDSTINMTVSLGIATYTINRQSNPEELVEQADHYLYQAKQNGRNRVCHGEPVKVDLVSKEEKQALSDLFGKGRSPKKDPQS